MTDKINTTLNRPKGCVAGCMVFDGGERKHHRDCAVYPESLTKLWHDTEAALSARIEELEAHLDRVAAVLRISLKYNTAMHGGAAAHNQRLLDTLAEIEHAVQAGVRIAEIKGEQKCT